ncbi:MAG: hypothetical protein JNK29_19360 [Anaerolineales bacterium]|nr:hypothetical protein [Anaerolineales bacterium]
MTDAAPLLETLTRRLAETPPDFLAEPRCGAIGLVHVDAVVADLLHDLGGGPLTPAQAKVFRATAQEAKQRRRRLRVQLLGAWLLHDPWFRGRGLAEAAGAWLAGDDLAELAEAADAPKIVADPDRREELARLCLRALGRRPAGETEAQAQDRLTTVSSVERQRVVQAAREAEQRMREIREAMARKAAEEAADKWSRE